MVQIEKNPTEKNESGPVQITDLDLTFYTRYYKETFLSVSYELFIIIKFYIENELEVINILTLKKAI